MVSPLMPQLSRRRATYLLLVSCVILSGLASRTFSNIFPQSLRHYPGDALWALMVMLLTGILLPSTPTNRVALLALSFAFVVELSQIAQWPWLVTIRSNPLGHLLLGSTFHAPDLLAYTVGVGLGVLLEWLLKFIPQVARIFYLHAPLR